MTTPLICSERLTMQFGGITAVNELDLAVNEGELVGLIGPNGCGKTTTINMLTGHLTPVAGRILLRGHAVHGWPAYKFAGAGVGRTFQVTQLFGRMSVMENMLVPGLARHGSTHAAARRQALLHLEFLGLAALQGLQARNLSGGQQKLLELGRALMLEPAILFLDEPFAGVNPFLRDEIIRLVRELHAQGKTFVVVDHDLEAIHRLVDRLVVMALGRKIADAAPDVVHDDPEVLRAYAGV
ncbi:MAG: ABC transporter ATP-binding protein [Acetobacteraceae bacterium]|nr:ABC transporter ATP-binding protein [Acetobacteraceae bacterium]